MFLHDLPAVCFTSRLFVIFCLICFLLYNNFVIPIIFIAFERTHTIRVASFWMLRNFMDWAPSEWTGWPLTSISCESFESRVLARWSPCHLNSRGRCVDELLLVDHSNWGITTDRNRAPRNHQIFVGLNTPWIFVTQWQNSHF